MHMLSYRPFGIRVAVCGDGIVSHGEMCDETSTCCDPATCYLTFASGCKSTKRALLYLRNNYFGDSLYDLTTPVPAGYEENPGDPCRWTGMVTCVNGVVTEMYGVF
jgi:hypothetical protein